MKQITPEISGLISQEANQADLAMVFPQKAFDELRKTGWLKVFIPGAALDFGKNPVTRQLHLLRQIGAAD
ncbi:MAG: hypothetical protein ABI151_04255, partial [Chitinophagaceae bacterium]